MIFILNIGEDLEKFIEGYKVFFCLNIAKNKETNNGFR